MKKSGITMSTRIKPRKPPGASKNSVKIINLKLLNKIADSTHNSNKYNNGSKYDTSLQKGHHVTHQMQLGHSKSF